MGMAQCMTESTTHSSPLSILIIGGRGRMGKLFAATLSKAGHLVDVLDMPETFDPDRIAKAQVVLLSVSLEMMVNIARTVLPLVAPATLLCDIGSLKVGITNVYTERTDVESAGFHPMFGPYVPDLSGLKMIACPVKTGPRYQSLCATFQSLGIRIHTMDAKAHDRTMAYVQAALHFTKIILGKVLADSSIPVNDTLAAGSPIFEAEVGIFEKIFAQDASLFAAIQTENPFALEARSAIVENALEIAADLAEGKPESFRSAFAAGSRYLSTFCPETDQKP